MGCCSSKNATVHPVTQQSHISIQTSASNTSFRSTNTVKVYYEPGRNYVTATPPKALKKWTLEDTYWEEKKKIMPQRNVIEKLDRHAQNVPTKMKVPVQVSPKELVNYLIRPAKTDVEKLRCLVRWIGANIEYEIDIYNKPGLKVDGTLEGVIRTGKAVCEGYAVVVEAFCRIAGIECKKVSGISKAAGYYPGSIDVHNPESDHAWNIVKLDGKPFFVESTWASGSSSEGENKKYTMRWDECWFLTNPKEFVFTHMPLVNGNQVDLESQLLKSPFQTISDWSKQIDRSPLAVFLGIDPISHQNCVFKTSTSELVMSFKNPHSMTIFAKINCISKKGNTRIIQRLQEELYTMSYNARGKYFAHFRLPGKGMYEISVVFQFPSCTEELGHAEKVAMYTVENTDNSKLPPLPQALNSFWGAQPKFSAAGFKLVSPKLPFAKAVDGKAIVRVRCPTDAWFPTVYDLTMSSVSGNKISQQKFDSYVYPEKNGDEITFHIFTPKKGEYKFCFGLKFEDDGEVLTGFNDALCILITSDQPCSSNFKIDFNRGIAGPNNQFFQMGLLSSSRSSTLKVVNGQANLSISKTRPASFHAVLECSGKEENVVKSYLMEHEEGDTTNYTITPKEPGIYALKLYVAESGVMSRPYGGTFVIPYQINI